IASSANFTCRLLRSASEYTATVRMPISWHALITRSAISPRLAIRTLRNIQRLRFFVFHSRRESAVAFLVVIPAGNLLFPQDKHRCLLNRKQALPVLHRLPALDE